MVRTTGRLTQGQQGAPTTQRGGGAAASSDCCSRACSEPAPPRDRCRVKLARHPANLPQASGAFLDQSSGRLARLRGEDPQSYCQRDEAAFAAGDLAQSRHLREKMGRDNNSRDAGVSLWWRQPSPGFLKQ